MKLPLGNTIFHPKFVKYFPIIEDSINILDAEIYPMLPNDRKYLSRWICLKLIDGDETILNSIEVSLYIQFNTYNLQKKLDEIHCLLEENDIYEDNLRDKMVSSIIFHAENICNDVVNYRNSNFSSRDRKIDKILTSKKFGIPIMIIFLGIIFWLTITGANYPSSLLSNFFGFIQEKLVIFFNAIHAPTWLTGILVDGMFQTVSWVVSVMLPPMAIFFPLFTILEDLGYLPRIAFNLDNYFKKACASGKQALTMCMGVTKRDFF